MSDQQTDPVAFARGWRAALSGLAREDCRDRGARARAAWNAGYAAAERERAVDVRAVRAAVAFDG